MLSAVVLTKNSSVTVKRCLSSLAFCDEILVIDDDSTDETVSIAKSLKAVVYSRSLEGDFAKQRNFGLAKAHGDLVLFVDSDEVISQELAQEIQNAIKDDSVDGWVFRRNDVLFGKVVTHGEIGAVRLLRLGRKGKGVWMRPVHEVWDIAGDITELTHPIIHYPHPTIKEFLDDINYYSDINAKIVVESGSGVSLFQIVAYPLGKFIQNYFFRLGFLDGMEGAILAFMMSFHSFLVRSKAYLLIKNNTKP